MLTPFALFLYNLEGKDLAECSRVLFNRFVASPPDAECAEWCLTPVCAARVTLGLNSTAKAATYKGLQIWEQEKSQNKSRHLFSIAP